MLSRKRIPAALGSVVLLLSAAAAPTFGAAAAGASNRGHHHDVEIRVVSYNMHTGIGADGQLNLARTAQALDSMDADVIGLEEVDVHWAQRSDWRDQARDLADALDMRAFFAPIYSLDPPAAGDPRREYGLAVLTDLRVMHVENHQITRLSTQDPDPVPAPAPGFPEVVVKSHGAVVHIYATHLDFTADPSIRAMQVRDTLEILDQDPRHAQQVLVGDFNAPPDSPELAPLWEELIDTWAEAGSGPGLTYPTTDPVKRIDYITVSPGIETLDANVVATDASDHLPVVADLVVRRGH